MEIPQDVQNKLKCSECDELLSCGPVYILHETSGAICGRCSQQPEQDPISNENNETIHQSRNTPYEATASSLVFPCAFAAAGCAEKLPFSLGQQPHELNCDFRPFVCPIVPSGSCEWIGPWPLLKDHCKEKHPMNVLENTCSSFPRPDLTTSNLQSYIVSAFNFLFLLQIKVCVNSGNFFNCLRMFGDPKFRDRFTYTLDVDGYKITEFGSILPRGIMMLQHPTAVCTELNSLLRFSNGTKFSITIHSKNSEGPLNLTKKCMNCSRNNSSSDFCEDCQRILVKCKFHGSGCSFADVNQTKCLKHEEYFCVYGRECSWHACKVNYIRGAFVNHLGTCFNVIKGELGSVVHLTPNANYVLFSSEVAGTVICYYELNKFNFVIKLVTSLPSHRLDNLICSIDIIDPQTKNTYFAAPQFLRNNYLDYYIKGKKRFYLFSANKGLYLKIHILKLVEGEPLLLPLC